MTKSLTHIAVIGAGAWGTALAQVFATAGHRITLYARDTGLADDIQKTRHNNIYLPGIPLHSGITATADVTVTTGANILLLVTPAQFVRATLEQIKPHLKKGTPLVNCAKGIEIATGKLMSEVVHEIVPALPYAVLSGPTFASEVAKGLPTAVTLATTAETAQMWAETLSSKTFRPYVSRDPVGAEIAGAVKNVIAIACGIVEGKGLGQNAKAAVMTRGMAEIKRLGHKKGAESETFLGLSGLGDLTLTCHSMASRNYSLGVELGRGQRLEDILAKRKSVSEGVSTAKAVAELASALQVDMPISTAVNLILHHHAHVDDIITELMARHLKPESD